MHSTMSDSVSRNDLDQLKDALQSLANAKHGCQVSDAALALLTAVHYDDSALVSSALESLSVALAGLANDCITKELTVSEDIKAAIMETWQQRIDRKAYDVAVFDEIKDAIESIIDKRIASMLKLREFVGALKKLDREVEKAQSLEDGIRSLRTFREDLLRRLPSRRSPSPINKDAVEKAREAIHHGEQGLTKGELVWGRKRS